VIPNHAIVRGVTLEFTARSGMSEITAPIADARTTPRLQAESGRFDHRARNTSQAAACVQPKTRLRRPVHTVVVTPKPAASTASVKQ
jgi:hypothetical protein